MENQYDLILLLRLLAIGMGFIVPIVLWYFSQANKANRFLSIAILALALALAIGVLLETGLILKLPHAYRTGNALALIYIAFSYLYFRGVILQKGFSRKDVIHLIPLFVYLIDFLPFFLLGKPEKTTIIESDIQDLNVVSMFNSSWIFPSGFHVLARITLAVIYWIMQLFLVVRFFKKDQRANNKRTNTWKRWIIGILIIQLIGFIPPYIGLVLHLKGLQWLIIQISGSTLLLFIAISLLFNPKILYGLRIVDVKNAPKKGFGPNIKSKSKGNAVISESASKGALHQSIIEFLQTKKPYLKSGYARHDLAADLNIHPHQLSVFLNNEIGLSFTDLINQYRIKYCVAQLEAGQMRNLKLEALASDCGFSNRNSFTTAFKRYTGKNPSQFIRELQ